MDGNLSRRRIVKTGQKGQQSRLTRSRPTYHRHRFPWLNAKRQALQYFIASRILKPHPLKLNRPRPRRQTCWGLRIGHIIRRIQYFKDSLRGRRRSLHRPSRIT